jgi:SAM-dependent methyltransferase
VSGPGDIRWDAERVARWVAQAEALDRQLAPVSALLFEGAALRPGERVLDVGCGTGPTTRQAASIVGAGGWVAGLDVSAEMLAAGAAAPAPGASAPIEWIEADASTWEPAIEAVDVVISRFGVMFFEDPVAAFTRLRDACRPGGRLCTMTWDRRDRTELFQVPMAATLAVLEARGLPVADLPVDGGAFSLGGADAVAGVLVPAGWSDVEVEHHAVRLRAGGGAGPAEAAEALVGIGPSRVLTDGLDDEVRAEVVAAVAVALEHHVDASGEVVLGGSVVRTRASRP